MIIYKSSDVKFSWEHYQNGEGHTHSPPKTCGYVNENSDYVLNMTEDSIENESETDNGSSKVKRQTETYKYTPTKTRCPLLLVVDYRFYNEIGGGSAKTTTNYLISLIDRVHKIYNDTLWQEHQEQDGFKGMGFVIKKIIVHSEPTPVGGGKMHYNMVRDKWDVHTLLEVFSREYSHKDFYLAHLFTDLKFTGGILGLAYVGSPRRNSIGGFCTPDILKKRTYFEDGYTLYLNSGLSSSRNHYGQRVITREADLVTAHEFGHNWGSRHDPLDITKFSPCSVRSISKNLQAKSWQCFLEPGESFSGNLRVERDEECEVGIEEDSDYCYDKNCKL